MKILYVSIVQLATRSRSPVIAVERSNAVSVPLMIQLLKICHVFELSCHERIAVTSPDSARIVPDSTSPLQI